MEGSPSPKHKPQAHMRTPLSPYQRCGCDENKNREHYAPKSCCIDGTIHARDGVILPDYSLTGSQPGEAAKFKGSLKTELT